MMAGNEFDEELMTYFHKYADKSDDALKSITVANGFSEKEEKAAKATLRRRSVGIDKGPTEIETSTEEHTEAEINDPIAQDIHQIATDVRFMRNVVIVGLVLGGIGFITSLINIFAH